MSLKFKYANAGDIPEAAKDSYTEKNGEWVLNVEGLPGDQSGDVQRLTEALRKEREDHKGTRDRLRPYEELGALDDLQDKLETAGKNNNNAELLTLKKRVRELEPFEAEAKKLREVEQKVKVDGKLREVIAALDPKYDRDRIGLLLAEKKIDMDDIGDLSAGGKPISEYIENQAKLFGFYKTSTPGESTPSDSALANAPKYEQAKTGGDIFGMIENAPAVATTQLK